MTIGERMVGRDVPCARCDAPVRVPEESVPRGGAQRRKFAADPGLTRKQYWLYALLFLFVPYACVFVSSILYYVWKADRPKSANQINTLGFIIFGINLLVGAILYLLLNRN
jgi:hypothetical protein